MVKTEQQISCVSAYFTHISKAKTQLFSKLCVSRTLDIFLIPNCEFLPSVSFVYNQNGACIKTSSQVKHNSTIVIYYAFLNRITPISAIGMCNKYGIPYYLYGHMETGPWIIVLSNRLFYFFVKCGPRGRAVKSAIS